MSNDKRPVVANDPWSKLRQYTPARIALGHSGTSLPTKPHLEFQLAHARARDAVHHALDIPALEESLRTRGLAAVLLNSRADSRATYLQRPDLGRRLDEASARVLENLPRPEEPYDVVFVIGDGLSALAIEENAAKFLDAMLPSLPKDDWHIAPLCIVKEARVAIGDEVAELLGAKMVVVLIGERPGLSSPDSMGIYMTLNPRTGLTDESRNCISNVRPAGLSYPHAAHKLNYLMTEARRRGLSGVMLKDEAENLAQVSTGSHDNFLIES
ncbi:ethanolamine ammonia-lyase subunit EutC [Methyloceanibacter caenitepidi]|uniref:Ethanolamine ammonia-lyase small subunit n=1 Tax=Methyloceanibacter caenitepidi TaxID=1384459 RepID=A0A0A8K266_9HYPH|nr:ethanolamine ammonia-lyase subunit EutC [Methyloceanibacter caenitepidi]BAQ16856.1 ethanolamine ammonia-lyase light chain [Methyloceanibacter caenitepidi]